MGIGTPSTPNTTAAEWNSGCCDIMAVALHRLYGLPIHAEFEYGTTDGAEALGFLMHACVRLPDGRFLDASGIVEDFVAYSGKDENDPWVEGYRIVEIADDDPHLLDTREEDDYRHSIEISGAVPYIDKHLAPLLQSLGIAKPSTMLAIDEEAFEALEALSAWSTEEAPHRPESVALGTEDGIGGNATVLLVGDLERIASISYAIDETSAFPALVEVDALTMSDLRRLADWIAEHAFDESAAVLGEEALVSHGELATIAGIVDQEPRHAPIRMSRAG